MATDSLISRGRGRHRRPASGNGLVPSRGGDPLAGRDDASTHTGQRLAYVVGARYSPSARECHPPITE